MPEATQDIHDTEDLGQRVGALLGEMQGGSGPPQSSAGTPGPPASTGVDAAPGEPPAQRPPDGAAGPAGWEPAPEPPVAQVAPQPARTPDEDLAKAVERLISTAPAEPPKAAPAEMGRIDSLDAELAGLADDLIAGEFKDEDAVLRDAPEAAGNESLTAGAGAPIAPTEAARPSPAAPAPEPAAAPVSQPPVERPSPGQAVVIEPEPGPALVARVLNAISSPLKDKPQHTRDMVGWIALVQAFLAVCLWGYLLFLRPGDAMSSAVGPPAKEHAPAKDKAGSGHGGSGQAPAPAKRDAKSRAPKKPGAKKDAAPGGH